MWSAMRSFTLPVQFIDSSLAWIVRGWPSRVQSTASLGVLPMSREMPSRRAVSHRDSIPVMLVSIELHDLSILWWNRCRGLHHARPEEFPKGGRMLPMSTSIPIGEDDFAQGPPHVRVV